MFMMWRNRNGWNLEQVCQRPRCQTIGAVWPLQPSGRLPAAATANRLRYRDGGLEGGFGGGQLAVVPRSAPLLRRLQPPCASPPRRGLHLPSLQRLDLQTLARPGGARELTGLGGCGPGAASGASARIVYSEERGPELARRASDTGQRPRRDGPTWRLSCPGQPAGGKKRAHQHRHPLKAGVALRQSTLVG